MNTNKTFLYAWYGMQGAHLVAYGIPGLVWPFIYLRRSSFIRRLFAYTWTYGTQILGPVAFAYTVVSLNITSYLYNKQGERDAHGNDLIQATAEQA